MRLIKDKLSVIVIFVVLIAVVLVNFSHHKWSRGGVIEYDVKAYYSYLPAAFIYSDLKLEFLKDRPDLYNEMWPVTLDNGNKLIVTSYGMSLMYSPFFFLAHAYASLDDAYEADGYSKPYRFALSFSSVAFLLLGLIILRKLLLRFYRDWIVALVLLAVAVGTNLAYFTTYKAPMPHSYNFALITLFTLTVIKWYESPSYKKALGVGALFGLIVLVRPSNILVLIILLLWGVKSWNELVNRVLFYIRRFDFVLIMVALFLLVWLPQFIYWKMIADKWLFYSYGAKDASFFWGNPQVMNILFSYRKGWFVYTPIMFIAVLGIFTLPYRLKNAFWPILIFVLLNIYVQSCWWCWWFGGGFSIRVFIDSYGILAIPLASVISLSARQKVLKFAIPIIILSLTWYNTFQIRQFRNSAIHFWWNTKEAYWENFLKLYPTHKYWDLVKIPDYYKARDGIYEAVTPVEKRRRDLWRNYRDRYMKRLDKQKEVKDSLMFYTENIDKTYDEALENLASKRVHEVLRDNEQKIKEKITNDKPWRKFIKKQAAQKNISFDSSLNIEATRIINSVYE